MSALPETHTAVVWHGPHDVHVEQVPTPQLQHADDAIVKVQLAGLCGSDLHVFRGDEDVNERHVCGHELIGTVVALGESFAPDAPASRPALYRTLTVGDAVVCPFTVSCGECEFCRLGQTQRCIHSILLGQPILPGAQAQYIRIPHAGGSLFALPSNLSQELPAPALLLLADILPTGLFVATQALSHAKIAPVLSGRAWPPKLEGYFDDPVDAQAQITDQDRALQLAVVGLGPVGLCATFALLDILAHLHTPYKLVAVDPNPARRAKLESMLAVVSSSTETSRGEVVLADPASAPGIVKGWGRGGCHAVLEVVGNNSALTTALGLLAPAGILSSCGVHQAPPVPFTGRELYNANVTLEFGRCPVRALFPAALRLLRKRADVLAQIGGAGLVERVVPLKDAPEAYEKFNKGEWGKVVFDVWA
ncbi:hypothetical protein PENSPDRAFT_658614 [Peniophora sp. CONT]|nr:hypothetical protein PENSPDRAFT_658614 [Peniophora sp. CONT]